MLFFSRCTRKLPRVGEVGLPQLVDSRGLFFKLIGRFDKGLARLQAQTAAYQTARMAYAKAQQSALPTMPAGDTLKFN